jgi:hypothetical protein
MISRRGASEVIVLFDGTAFDLPEVRLPQNQRLAWNLNAALKNDWQLDVVSIAPSNVRSQSSVGDPVRYHLAELIQPNVPLPSGMRWATVSSLTSQSFLVAADYNALRAFHEGLSASPSTHAPFEHLGWFREVTSWIEDAIIPFRLQWNGRFEQFHASASFSLIRFETLPRAVWFKAVGEPNTREFAIIRELSKHCQEYVPRLLAVRPDWNGWLAEECPGKTLDQVSDIDLWRHAVRSLANLQVESLSWSKSLLLAGAHDLRTLFARPAVERFFALVERLIAPMAESVTPDFPVEDLRLMKGRMLQLLDHAGNSRVPEALGHLDLNAGNVVVSSGQCGYLDWAEAYVGPPFLALDYLLQNFRRAFGRGSQHESSVVQTYLTVWEPLIPFSDIRDFWGLTPALAVFAYAQRCLLAAELTDWAFLALPTTFAPFCED